MVKLHLTVEMCKGILIPLKLGLHPDSSVIGPRVFLGPVIELAGKGSRPRGFPLFVPFPAIPRCFPWACVGIGAKRGNPIPGAGVIP